ncbi:hypothetical protein ACTFIU_002686 [Dictyostelium citrinum]
MIFQDVRGFEEEEDDSILITVDKNYLNRYKNKYNGNNRSNNNNNNNDSNNNNVKNSNENNSNSNNNNNSFNNSINNDSSNNNSSNKLYDGSDSLDNIGGSSINDFEMPVDAYDHNQLYLNGGGSDLKKSLTFSKFLIKNNDEDNSNFDELEIEMIDDDDDNNGDDEGGSESNKTPFKRNRSLLEFTQGYEDPDELEISCEGGSTISSLYRDEVITDYFEPNVDEQPYYNKLKIRQQQQYQQQQLAIQQYQQQQQLQQLSTSPSSITSPILQTDHHNYSERKINIPKVRFGNNDQQQQQPQKQQQQQSVPTTPRTNTTTTNITNINTNKNINLQKLGQEQSNNNKQINNNNNNNKLIEERNKIYEKQRKEINQEKRNQFIQKHQQNYKQQKDSDSDIIEESAGEGDGPEGSNSRFDEDGDDEDGDDEDEDDRAELVYSFDEIKGCSCFSPYLKIVGTNRNYTLLWIASLISLAGDWLNEIACLTILDSFQTSSSVVAMFLVVRESPPFLFQFLTGVVSDTFDRRYIMIIADIVRMILVLFFLFVRSKSLTWLLFVLAFLQYGTGSFYNPSKSALLPSIVPKHDLVTANALDQSSYSSMMLLGASLGGLISFALGTDVNFILDSLTYAASGLCIFLLIKNTKNLSKPSNNKNNNIKEDSKESNNNKDDNNGIELKSNLDNISLIKNDQLNQSNNNNNEEEEEEEEGVEQEIKELNENGNKKSIGKLFKEFFSTYKYGFKYLMKNKYIFLIVFSKACGSLIWGVADMINIQIAKTTFKMGDEGSLSLGIILGAGGFGILMIPLFFSRIVKDVPSNYNKILKVGFFMNGFCTFCLGLSANHFPLYLIFNSIRSSSTCIIWMYSSSFLQQLLPDEVRGRVFSLEYALITIFNNTSKLVVGYLLDNTKYSLKEILITTGFIGILMFAVWLMLFKRFKRSNSK